MIHITKEKSYILISPQHAMRNQRKKTFILSTLIVYLVSLFTQWFSVLFEVRAQNANIPHVNMVAVFVDDNIYDKLNTDIQWYATQYIQQEIPESKALVMPLNLNNIDALQIHQMLENIYFDGLEGVNSTLLGVILIGNIPLPVINQDGYIFPSIYPYVDFLEQKYVRDPNDQYFIPNGNEKGQAEIWHGLIDYDERIADYQNFFNKIKAYKENPQDFIGKDMWYEDFIANKNGFLEDNLQFYQNKILFSEDIGYQRFTPLMLKTFQGTQNEGAATITNDLANVMKELGGSLSNENGGTLDIASQIATMESSTDKGVSTKVVEKSIKDSFLLDYPKIYSTKNAVTLRDNVMAGGRWLTGYQDEDGAQLITRTDSSIDKINLKDIVNGGNESVQGALLSFNTALEKAVDKKIEEEKYDMDIVLPVSYATTQAEKVGGCKRVLGIKICKNKTNKYLESKYEVFYFGKSANLISSAQELSIYRGSYRNLSTLSGINYTTLQSGSNPAKDTQDKTTLSNKSIGASYDIFSTQVEANRGYNLLNTQDEYNNYEKNKQYA
ncbi:MAG: hypothetical protein LBD75_07825 [Candidatus Peribacteria bacterium]|jgi:hypothetical protein|nr:hypothetical protein [Candidatus Peribacteria bacterium]